MFYIDCAFHGLLIYFSGNSLADYSLTDNEYKYNMGNGYVFFEVLEPDEISYTYKLNPAAFSPPWNESFGGEIKLVPGYPECGCSYLQNNDDIEGQIGIWDSKLLNVISRKI